MLRPLDEDGRKGGHPADFDPLPTFIADTDSAPHDESRLPHMHTSEEIARLFPTIEAAPEQPDTNDYDVQHNDYDDPNRSSRLMPPHPKVPKRQPKVAKQ